MMARDRDDDRRERNRSRDDDDGFKYRRRSVDDVRKRASEKTSSFDSFIKPEFKRYKVRDGKNLIRILEPTWDDPKHYAYTIFLNYSIGADNQTFLSLSEMKGEKDPLAEARKEAQHEGDKEMAKALTPRKRSLMWIIDRTDEDEGPMLWDAPFTVDTDFVNLSIDEDTKEVIYVDDPKEGCDIRFYKEGQGIGTKYPAARMKILAPSPLSEDKGLMKEWRDFVKENPVPDCLQYFDYDHIQEAFDGIIGSYDDDKDDKGKKGSRDDDDDRPRRSRSRDDDEDDKPRRKPREDDNDSDAEKPRRREREKLDEDDDEADAKPRGKDRDADKGKDNDEDDNGDEGKPRQSIRDRLKARRSKPADDDDE
jgi:hypothetical protein